MAFDGRWMAWVARSRKVVRFELKGANVVAHETREIMRRLLLCFIALGLIAASSPKGCVLFAEPDRPSEATPRPRSKADEISVQGRPLYSWIEDLHKGSEDMRKAAAWTIGEHGPEAWVAIPI